MSASSVAPSAAPAGTPAARFHIHLVSDSTGETLKAITAATLVQFPNARSETRRHVWSLVRTPGQMQRVLKAIEAQPGMVMFTLMDAEMRSLLEQGCRRMSAPCIAVLDPVLAAMSSFLGEQAVTRPGRQHQLDSAYFSRIDAVQFTLAHDDGHLSDRLAEADIVLVGVSRTSKTPTAIYLANMGMKTANIPFVPNMDLPEELDGLTRPLIVGLTNSPERLIQVRRSRLRSLKQDGETVYVDPDAVREEVAQARRLFADHGWPVIDVSRRSIEETAAAIITLYERHRDKLQGNRQSPDRNVVEDRPGSGAPRGAGE
ncbi:pyruvate, water dikinase regulatory protein [Marinibaculum pumilum]|uniref:Putative pyruvate, phosphate dikinase regulatory protein n=1 Tax=Marinibaculum pumilum TaxID=1766165 RepID=A0ABV7KUU4_9PROT